MKHISILACILVVCFVSTAWAQQVATRPLLGKHLLYGMTNRKAKTPNAATSHNLNTWANANHRGKMWELGTYPGGTWFATWHVNDHGVVVGLGDVPPIGSKGVGNTHTLAVPLFGPHAGEWVDIGVLRKKQPKEWEEPFVDISNTGLVVSHSTAKDGYAHGVAWTKEAGIVDLGTLADTGNPKYASYKSSYAIGTNKLGTLIVGNSGVGLMGEKPSVPVVWTPSIRWQAGKFVTRWKIHKLNTSAFPDLTGWTAWSVNALGQIVGVGANDDETILNAALWNPRAHGRGWERPMPLLPIPSSGYPSTDPYGINENGDIVGGVTLPDQSMWLSVFWKPLNSKRTKYSPVIELPVPEGGFTSCEGVGINDLGDLVGDCWNEDGSVDLAVRWTTKNPNFSEIMNFPGDWGFAWGVNNHRIAAVTYGGGEKCPADTYASCGGATHIH